MKRTKKQVEESKPWAHVTVIGKRTPEEMQSIRDHYEPLGFKVDHVDDMSAAVDGLLGQLKDWC